MRESNFSSPAAGCCFWSSQWPICKKVLQCQHYISLLVKYAETNSNPWWQHFDNTRKETPGPLDPLSFIDILIASMRLAPKAFMAGSKVCHWWGRSIRGAWYARLHLLFLSSVRNLCHPSLKIVAPPLLVFVYKSQSGFSNRLSRLIF